jgi:hypothetical protein
MADYSFSGLIEEARLALRHVKSLMVFGAGNKLSDTIPTLGFSIMATSEARKMQDKQLADIKLKLKPDTRAWNIAYVEAMASSAQHWGAGNCGEQAALAFQFLRNKGIRPLDYCRYQNSDHAFVILRSLKLITPSNFKEWSVDAVLCDPWYNRAEIAGMMATRGVGRVIISEVRLD